MRMFRDPLVWKHPCFQTQAGSDEFGHGKCAGMGALKKMGCGWLGVALFLYVLFAWCAYLPTEPATVATDPHS